MNNRFEKKILKKIHKKYKILYGGGDINDELFEACDSGNLENVKLLLENGANIHADNDRALMLASENGYLDIVKFLLKHGANIHAQEDSAIFLAIENEKYDIVKFLVKNGVNVDRFLILKSISRNQLNLLKFFVKHGADIHFDNDYPFITASIYGYLNIMKYLLEKGSNINAIDMDYNKTALNYAIDEGHFEIVKFLIEKGANIGDKIDLNIIRDKVRYSENEEEKQQYLDILLFLTKKLPKKFPIAQRKILSLVKDKNIYYKWERLCSSFGNKDIDEIKNAAKIQGIPIQNKSKKELCQLLKDEYKKQMLIIPECHNDTTILGDDVNLIPKPLLFTFKDGDFNYCFNIIELMESINKGDTTNPWTRNPLPIDLIKDRFVKLREILIESKLSLTNILDEIKNNKIMTKENILRLKITNLIALLKYTPNIEEIINMNQKKINSMFDLLNENPLMHVFGAKNLNNFIDESLRLLQIEDEHKNTRKQAFETYLNNVFNENSQDRY